MVASSGALNKPPSCHIYVRKKTMSNISTTPASPAKQAPRGFFVSAGGTPGSGATVFSPLRAVRESCLDCCCGGRKDITYCTCDGIHSTRCALWPYRFGSRPETIAAKYGPALVTPSMMPDEAICVDDLPASLTAAAAYLASCQSAP